MDKRVEDDPRLWTAVLPQALKKYNEKMVHSTIGMTPEEATNPGAEFDVKTNLGIKRIYNRKYPELKKNDSVRVYKKKRSEPRNVSPFGTRMKEKSSA